MTEEEKAICKQYSARDEEGKVHCMECPLVIDKLSYTCKATEELHYAEYIFDFGRRREK